MPSVLTFTAFNFLLREEGGGGLIFKKIQPPNGGLLERGGGLLERLWYLLTHSTSVLPTTSDAVRASLLLKPTPTLVSKYLTASAGNPIVQGYPTKLIAP